MPKAAHVSEKEINKKEKKTSKEKDVSKKSSISEGVKKKRIDPKRKILKEIKKQQNSSGYAIRRLPFQRLVREIIDNYAPTETGFRVSGDAFEILQYVGEKVAVDLFGNSNCVRASAGGKRKTLYPNDMIAAITCDPTLKPMMHEIVTPKLEAIYRAEENRVGGKQQAQSNRIKTWKEKLEDGKRKLALLEEKEKTLDANGEENGTVKKKKKATHKKNASKQEPEPELVNKKKKKEQAAEETTNGHDDQQDLVPTKKRKTSSKKASEEQVEA